jgi:hypothetical protein
MPLLQWTFDRPMKRAVSVARYGTYVIQGDEQKTWTAKFHRAVDKEKTVVLTREDHGHTMTFEFMAVAMRSCQRHNDSFSSETSGRLSQVTPLPQ